jgi:hypothetical protein
MNCAGCGREALGKARDWIALLFDDPEDADSDDPEDADSESPAVVVYCPSCALQLEIEDRR